MRFSFKSSPHDQQTLMEMASLWNWKLFGKAKNKEFTAGIRQGLTVQSQGIVCDVFPADTEMLTGRNLPVGVCACVLQQWKYSVPTEMFLKELVCTQSGKKGEKGVLLIPVRRLGKDLLHQLQSDAGSVWIHIFHSKTTGEPFLLLHVSKTWPEGV